MAVATPPHPHLRRNSRWLIAIVAVVGVIVATVGIGFGTGFFRFGNQAGPMVASSPTPQASPSALVTPSQSPTARASPTPSAATPAAVLVGFTSGDGTDSAGYDVSIVGLDGKTIASVHAPMRSHIGLPVISGPSAIYTPLVNVAGNHVYYLSGDSNVRMLSRDGSTQSVTTVPGSATAHAAFAVSPDESRIAVSVLDYSASLAHPEQPVHVVTDLYVEDLRTHAHHVEIFASSTLNLWPIAWHAGNLVLAVGGPYTQQGIVLNPYSAGEFHVVDAVTADRLATMGSATCWPLGLLTAAGVACYTRPAGTGTVGSITVQGWNGQVRAGSPTYAAADLADASVSPDGTKLAVFLGSSPLVVQRAEGIQQTTLPGGLYAFPCWIDNNHVMSASPYDQPGLPAIMDIRTGSVITTAAHGMCAAISPSDLN